MKIFVRLCLAVIGTASLSSCISSKKIEDLNLAEHPSNKIVRAPADSDPKYWKIRTDLFETVSNSNIIEELKKNKLNEFHIDADALLDVGKQQWLNPQSLNLWYKNSNGEQGPIRVESSKGHEGLYLSYGANAYKPRVERKFFEFENGEIDVWPDFLKAHQEMSATEIYRKYVQIENEFIDIDLKAYKRCRGWRIFCTESFVKEYRAKEKNYAYIAHLLRQKMENEPIPNFESIAKESHYYKTGHFIRFSKDKITQMKMMYYRLLPHGDDTNQLHLLIAFKNSKESVICVDIATDEISHISCYFK